jgi:hypothetical protein
MNDHEILFKQLDEIVKLLGLTAKRGVIQNECIRELGALGFAPKRIAEILGTTSNVVRVALFHHRKNSKGRSRWKQ